VLFVRKSLGGPLSEDFELELRTISRHLDVTFIGTSAIGPRWTHQVIKLPLLRPRLLGGMLFYPTAALMSLCMTAGKRGGIVCWSVLEGLPVVALNRLLPSRIAAKVTVEVHGDWRSGLRLYGHPIRRSSPRSSSDWPSGRSRARIGFV
jgi:hypothetical protein